MKKYYIKILLLATILFCMQKAEGQYINKLIFVDDFDGNSLDMTKWENTPEHQKIGHGSYQTHDGSNIDVSNGILKIIAKKVPVFEGKNVDWDYDTVNVAETDGVTIHNKRDFNVTTASIRTKEFFKYGVYEANFKVPVGAGMWPAFWLFGQVGDYREEIDIMEMDNTKPQESVHTDFHFTNILATEIKEGVSQNCLPGASCLNAKWHCGNLGNGTSDLDCILNYDPNIPNFRSQFNKMTLVWFPPPNAGYDFLIYVNDHLIRATEGFKWLSKNPMQIILNLAVCAKNVSGESEDGCGFGTLISGNDDPNSFPSTFEIDYVKVWGQNSVSNCSDVITISEDIGRQSQSQYFAQEINLGGPNYNPVKVEPNTITKLIATDKVTISGEVTITPGELGTFIATTSGDLICSTLPLPSSSAFQRTTNSLDSLSEQDSSKTFAKIDSSMVSMKTDSLIKSSSSKKSKQNDTVGEIKIKTNTSDLLLNNDDFKILIFPNPSNGIVKVYHAKHHSENNISLTLYDAKGLLLYRELNINRQETQLNLSDLPAGVYSLVLIADEKVVKEKIILSR